MYYVTATDIMSLFQSTMIFLDVQIIHYTHTDATEPLKGHRKKK